MYILLENVFANQKMSGTRTKFEELEIAALNEVFEMHNQYPSRQVMESMAEILDKPSLVVKNWFRNKRKSLHWRKNKRVSPNWKDSPPSASSISPGTTANSASSPAVAQSDSDNEIPSAIVKQEIQEEEPLALVSSLPPIDSAEQSMFFSPRFLENDMRFTQSLNTVKQQELTKQPLQTIYMNYPFFPAAFLQSAQSFNYPSF
jgi:hypothetical protein